MVVDMRPQVGTFTAERFRHVMSHVPTGIAVVSAMTRGGPVGLTVGTFLSASLDPPLIGFLPSRTSTTWPVMVPVGSFCVSVLGEEDEELCRRFAATGGDKFASVPWRPASTGSPIVERAIAWFDCRFEHCYPAGDHWFVLGRVVDLDVRAQSRPLVFCQGSYQRLAPHGALRTATRDGA